MDKEIPTNIVADESVTDKDTHRTVNKTDISTDKGGYGNVSAWNDVPEAEADKAIAN